jgi:cyclase
LEAAVPKIRAKFILGARISVFLVAIVPASMFLLNGPARASADSVNTAQRTVTKLADGVYVIRHKDAPDTFPQGNTTVVIGESGVLVVDSCYLPSTAREDIAQIKQWTNLPVRYVFNTHWHMDHNYGNAAYAETFPGLTIVAQAQTAKMMALREPAELTDYQKGIAAYQRQFDTGKDAAGQPLSELGKADLKTAIAGSAAVWKEFQNLKPRYPDLTFEHELDLDLGGRTVELKFLGRGNTSGDSVAYLPKEKILATGDLVDHPVPYLGGGFPAEQISTLERLKAIDADILVPGHGDVLHGKEYVQLEIDFLTAVVGAVDQYILGNGAGAKRHLEELRKFVETTIDMPAWRQKFAGDDADARDFFDSFSGPGVVDAAHAELWPR